MYMVSLLSILPFTAPACGSAQGGGEAPGTQGLFRAGHHAGEYGAPVRGAGASGDGQGGRETSTGEPGGHNFLKPELIKDLVQKVDDTIVECNTAYGGGRASTENHLKAAADHGFTAIAPVDIMDAEGEVSLPRRAAGTSGRTSWGRTTPPMISRWCSRTSRGTPWAASAVR